MAASPLGAEVSELALCGFCRRPFNDHDRQPKPLACAHHLCLQCLTTHMLKGKEVYCVQCSYTSTNCQHHNMPHSLWCLSCRTHMCRACAHQPEHSRHTVKAHADAAQSLRADASKRLDHMHHLLQDIQRLVTKQREFLLKILEACTTLKTQVETDLVNNAPGYELSEARECLAKAHRAYLTNADDDDPQRASQLLAALDKDKDRLHAKHNEMFLQCKLDDLIKNSTVPFDFELLKRALQAVHDGETPHPPTHHNYHNPVLFLANYCMSQLYSRHFLFKQQQHHNGQPPPLDPDDAKRPHAPQPSPSSSSSHRPQPPPSRAYPVFYFNIEINGAPFGRVLVEVRSDVAPKMAKNFAALATGELGIGYKGCSIFQCWENESIITGDFELNNGRGGRSVFEESFFMPDDTKILAVRGSVGMRRSQKRHDNLGLVGSQFRIILREMRGFTGIFAFVVEGLELVDRISQSGDSAGKPQTSVLIASCGKLN